MSKQKTSIVLLIGIVSILMISEISGAQTSGTSITLNGASIYFEAYGSGKPLLLLHGITGTGKFYSPIIAELAQYYRLIVPDLRGHGRFTNPDNGFTHRQAASDIIALLNHLSISEYSAIGYSSGSMILIHMATREKERPKSLVLLSGTPYFTKTGPGNKARCKT